MLKGLSKDIQERAERFYDPKDNEIEIPAEWGSPESNPSMEEAPIETLPWIHDIDPKERKSVLPTIPIPYRLRLGLGFILFIFCLIAIGQLLTSISQNLNSLILMLPLTFVQLDYLLKTYRIANKKWYFSQVKKSEN